MRVAIVTDSTASLPAELAAQWRITVVPMQIKIDDTVDDEARVPRAVLLDALRARRAVSTAPPDQAAFFWAYRQAAANGADAVVSVHISAKQSKTYEHAMLAAARSGIPVHVLDSGTSGMSLGYAVIAAAKVAAAGGDPVRVMNTVTHRLSGSSELIYVDSIDYLRRGGRIGSAGSLLGGALSLKPLLTLRGGEVSALDRVLGSQRAIRRLADRVVASADARALDLAVEHVGVPAKAEALLAALIPRLPQARETLITEASSTLAVHLGPGALGVTLSPATRA